MCTVPYPAPGNARRRTGLSVSVRRFPVVHVAQPEKGKVFSTAGTKEEECKLFPSVSLLSKTAISVSMMQLICSARRSIGMLSLVCASVLLFAPQDANGQLWLQTSRVVTPSRLLPRHRR